MMGCLTIQISFVFVVPQLVHGGKLDYLVFDYLSEITMSLLTAVKKKNEVCESNYIAFLIFTFFIKIP